MGCGASNVRKSSAPRVTRTVVAIHDNSVTKSIQNGHLANKEPAVRKKKLMPPILTKRQLSLIDESSLEKQPIASSTDKAVQTENESIHGFKTQHTQTDHDLLPEEELEMLVQENGVYFQNYVQSLDVDESSASPIAPLTPLLSNVNHENGRSISNEKKSIGSLEVRAQLTIDVGVQVKWTKTNISTQTKLAILHKKIGNRTDGGNRFTVPHCVPKLHDFESQTDPLTEVLAANGAGSDLNVLHSYEISSPFSHIEKELSVNSKDAKKKNFDIRLQEALNKLLDDMEDSFGVHKSGFLPSVRKRDAIVQTDNDPITDEAPEFAARPPPTRKKEMVPSLVLFREVDKIALEAPEEAATSVPNLVNYLCETVPNDLFKVRAIFRWIAENIKYDWKYMGMSSTSNEILATGEGVCKDYCQLFADMCRAAGLRVKKIQGFAKGYDYRPGHQFKPGEDITHNWIAVYVLGAWRFIDPTWGTGYTDHSGKFQKKLNEHFFLTDPESLIWTHFPFDDMESNYERWQLLDKPIALDDFNSMPKVTPFFFEFNLKIRTKFQNPITFRVQTEIKIGAHEAMRYKYKLYPSDEVENSSLNHYVFCQLKEDRLVGSFICVPPVEGRYYLKIYAKPERHMQEKQTDSSSLHSAVTFLLECSRARKYIEPFPLNELPWGPTQSFYDYHMKLHNQIGPVISTWGGKRRLCIESVEPMLITYQVMDSDGMEMDVKNLIIREDQGNKINFTISFPRVGTFKFMIFGMPKPKQKGKWRLPLLATFLIDCKLAKLPAQDEDPPPERPSNAELPDSERRKARK